MTATDGPGSLTLFDDFDPDTSWLRTQTSYSPLGSIESFEKYSAPWPTTGLLSSGTVSRRAPWVHHTHDDGCSLWPTPTAAMGHRGWGLGPAGSRPIPGVRDRSRAWRDRVVGSLAASRADDRETDGSARRLVKAGGNAVVAPVAEYVGRLIVNHADRV